MGVRWDAVVSGSRFWAQPEGADAPAPAAGMDAPVSVQVFLFGTLAKATADRPITLALHHPFRIADVMAELGRRYGGEFLSLIAAPNGVKLNHCRVYVNGEPATDPARPIQCGRSSAQIEIILLTAVEGG
jgi:hypothetical protein